MKSTEQLRELGQSLWLDNITRTLLDDGTLARYIAEDCITGLTSNPSIFAAAIAGSEAYDADIQAKALTGHSGENIFIELALVDLRRAAELFRPAFDASRQVDGWVSMEVSPLLVADTEGTVAAARQIHSLAECENLFVKIPGTWAGVPAIEEAIFLGIPINVTLLFSREQYLAAAAAYMRGIERRIEARRDPQVRSVASLFVSRWDVASNAKLPKELQNHLGIAIARQTYCAYRELLLSPRWQRLAAAGAQPQRLLWASTGTKDPSASETLYVNALAAPHTINTMPEKTLRAFAERGQLTGAMPKDGGNADAVLAQIHAAGVDVAALAATLQQEGAASFIKSWQQMLVQIQSKVSEITSANEHTA